MMFQITDSTKTNIQIKKAKNKEKVTRKNLLTKNHYEPTMKTLSSF